MEGSIENLDVKVKFMHPKLPSPSLKWPNRDDLCWVPVLNPGVYLGIPFPRVTVNLD